MSGVNKVIILGRLGADPEVKSVGNGSMVARLSIATSESWNDKEGQKQERTEWHRVVVWGKLAELCGKYLSKGRQAYVEGRLQTRQWEDAQGQKRYSTEVVASTVQFIGSGSATTERSGEDNSHSPFQDFTQESAFGGGDDNLPF